MGILDTLIKKALGGGGGKSQLGGLMELAAKNPKLTGAVASLLSTKDPSVGGAAGLAGLVGAFQKKGLGDMMSSWISKGPNPPVSAAQVSDVLGADVMAQFADKAGVPATEAGSALAGVLPTVINELTPKGKVPKTSSLEKTLGSLLSGLKG